MLRVYPATPPEHTHVGAFLYRTDSGTDTVLVAYRIQVLNRFTNKFELLGGNESAFGAPFGMNGWANLISRDMLRNHPGLLNSPYIELGVRRIIASILWLIKFYVLVRRAL